MSSLLQSNPATARHDLVERGQTVYRQRLASILEPSHIGEFVAVEPDSGHYFAGSTASLVACCRSRCDAERPFLPHARWARDCE